MAESMSDVDLALRALRLLDLTDLSDTASETATAQLCARALAAPGPVAAICIWPQFVAVAHRTLRESPVRIATVVNFPAGGTNCGLVGADITQALADGADEIDLVLPWRAFLAGEVAIARDMLDEARERCGERTLKVIVETGEYPDQGAVRAASDLAIAAGADFIKTSTGKTPVSATPQAARTMLEAIAASGRPVGLKPSGGLRSLEDARTYLDLADAAMGPDWATPERFRFGASGLYGVLAEIVAGTQPGERGDGAY